MYGREIIGTTLELGFLNVPEDCHIEMIQRNAPESELLWDDR